VRLRSLFGTRIDHAEETPAPPPRLGLVLGGGAVRGAAHVGVLTVLEREGIRPDAVAGTSVGAIVGAGVAAGISSAEMYEHFVKARWRDLARPSWSRLSLFETDPMGSLLERICEADTFDDLKIPFAAVASDILSGKTFVFTEGSLHEALVASSAIPGLFEPVPKGDSLLVDGGITDNLPVAAARDLGATATIAVDIMPALFGTYRPADVRDMVMMSWNILEQAAASGRDRADLLITPDVGRVSFSDFSQAQAAYEAGVAAAKAVLPELLRLAGADPGKATDPGGRQ
jgi:NTE family protein